MPFGSSFDVGGHVGLAVHAAAELALAAAALGGDGDGGRGRRVGGRRVVLRGRGALGRGPGRRDRHGRVGGIP